MKKVGKFLLVHKWKMREVGISERLKSVEIFFPLKSFFPNSTRNDRTQKIRNTLKFSELQTANEFSCFKRSC